MTHRSHISSKEAKSRGWSRVPSPAIQRETKKQEVGIDYMSANYVSVGASDCTCGWTTTNTAGDYWYYPVQTWANEWTYIDASDSCSPTITVQTILKEKGVTIDMRTLFKVYVVDPRKNGKVLLDGFLVIAVNENQAMLKAGVADIASEVGLDLEQVDVYVQTIGTFIRPRKETQRVKMVKEEEE